MIRPTYKKLDRFGVQGRIGFDPTKSNANIPLYDAVQKLIAGKHGLAGAGGPVANRIVTENMFQQSNVFNTPNDRDAVTERMERQFTEQLKTLVGNQAQAAGMQIPEFLQSQGIHGVQQFGSGDNIRYSAFSNDDFIHTSFNPLTGSNERALKAMMTKSGAKPVISGGTNERRTMEVYLREAEFKAAQKMTNMKAKKLNIGTSNKGDLEAIYATQRQRSEIKSKHSRNKNDVALSLMEDENSPIREEVRSKILKQEREKEIWAQETETLKEKGLISGDKNQAEKERKQSPAAAAAKGMMAVISRIGTTISTIKNLVGTMIGLLKTIAMQTGRIVMDSATLGIDPQVAKRMQLWGAKNPNYTEGNEFLLLDAVKEFKAKFGDLIRFDKNANFSSAAFNDYSELIDPTLKASLQKNPLMGTQLIYGAMAKRYMSMGSPEAKRKELMKQQTVLTDEWGSTFAQAYLALIKSGEEGKWLTKGNAANIFNEAIEGNKVHRSSSGVHLDHLVGGVNSAVNISHNNRNLNNVLGDVALIKDALLMKLLTKIDMLIQVMDMLTVALLTVFKSLNVSGAKEGLDEFNKARTERAHEGYKNLRTNSLKYRNDAEAGITAFLAQKGLKGDVLSSARTSIFSSIFSGEALPENYKGVVDGQRGLEILAAVAAFKTSQQKLREIYSDVSKKGIFRHSGDTMNMMYESGSVFQELKGIYNNPNDELSQAFIDRVEGRRLSKEQRSKLKTNLFDTDPGSKVKMYLDPFNLIETEVDVPGGSTGGGNDALDIEAEAAEKKVIDNMKKFRFGKKQGFNFNLYKRLSDSLASSQLPSVGGGLTTSSEPFVITHNVNLSVDGAKVLSKTDTLYSNSEKQFFLNNTQHKVRIS